MGVFLIKQFMESNVPEVLIEAARIDGAGAGRIFWQLVMPLAKPAWLTLTLFSFQSAWAATGGNLIFSESLKTLPSVMGSVVSSGLARSGSAMAVTVLMMIPPVLIYMATQSNVLEKIFMKSGIAYRILGGLRFYERKEIRDMMAYLGADPKDAVVFGDGENDKVMFGKEWLSIAMGDGDPGLLAIADHVTDAAVNDGIRNACISFGWIRP